MEEIKLIPSEVGGEPKYTFYMKNHSVACKRYGEQWRDFVGDGAVLALYTEVVDLLAENKQLKKAIDAYGNDPAGFDWTILGRLDKLEDENERLKEALGKHIHTQKCFEYAAKTARQSGSYYCIAECADSHKQALKDS